MDRSSDRKRTRYDRDGDDHRDRDHSKHHRSRDESNRDSKHERDRDRSHHRDRKSSRREEERDEENEGGRMRERTTRSKREKSYEREGSAERERERSRREKSYEREGSRDREKSLYRDEKERVKREESSEEDKARVSNSERRDKKRKFEDKIVEDEDNKNVPRCEAGENVSGGGSVENGASATLKPCIVASGNVPESAFTTNTPLQTKVSSNSTTNENKGVSITRFHEVPGKSSTDGAPPAAGKSGNLSLDALTKAKKALQMQKDLAARLKKIPLLNKGASSSSDAGLKDGSQALPSSVVTAGSKSTSSTLPATSVASMKPPVISVPGLATVPNLEVVKRAQELAAKMGFRQDPLFPPLLNLSGVPTDVTVQQKPTKAPVLRVDALGREIDEHGNVISVAKPSSLSTLKVNINKQKKDAFQILKPELEVDPETNPHFDASMGINKTKLLRPKRMAFQFVEEGKWSKDAETIRLKNQFGEAGAKEQRAKQAQLARAKAAPDINPNLIEVSERVIATKEKPKEQIPDTEWWDIPLLLSGSYGDIMDSSVTEDKLQMNKMTIYVQHPRPIDPPAEPAPPPPQPLKLTKRESKKLRTQRRLAMEKEKQEMIRQGLIEPPKAKVKMSNLMKVLGPEATQDPTRLEMEIRSAAAEREQAHVDRNIARKLTPAERREKKERKLFDDPNTLETIVSVYKINDLSHKQTRFKVDVNAKENRLTGCAVISEGISVVVVEGGTKSIKRYGKLMLRRINWPEAREEADEDDEDEDRPPNKCVLVWQGSVAKPSFYRFFVHECMTEAAAKKVFADAGVAHYWDLAVNYVED